MANKSRGDYAYTMIDVEDKITDNLVKKLDKIDGVIRVRVVKKEL